MFASSITPEEIECLEMAVFPGKIQVIDRPGEEFDKAAAYLGCQAVIGFDTESRPCFSAGQPHYGISLLQLSGADKAFLFRVKAMGLPGPLCDLLSEERILKVGAAVCDDVRGLQRLAAFRPAGFVDLQKIVCEYGITDKSVKKMAAIILGLHVSKAQQLSNWEAAELSEAQLNYAATDAWICREMYRKLLKSPRCALGRARLSP